MKMRRIAFAAVLILATTCAAAAQLDGFAEAMRGSMERMHAAMMVAPRGDPDRDFAAMMIPHHQGAVDMAEAELKYGKNERLRRLAQGIIVEQRQEIMVMQGILAEKNGTLPNDQTPMGDMK